MRLLGMTLIALLLAVSGRAQVAPAVTGDYIEVRSGHVYTCGCLYSGEAVTGGKEAILIWQIGQGEYQGMPLAGIKVAAVVVAEGNLGTEDVPRRSVLFLDGATSAAQKEAVISLWRRQHSTILGEVTSIRDVPIRMEQHGDWLTASILGVAHLEVRKARLPEDAHLGSFLWYGPFATLRESTLATALLYEYSGSDFQRQWRDTMPSISGYMGNFMFTVER